jgi:2'-5' RNA ligase
VTALVLLPAYTPPLPDDAHLTLVWPGNQPGADVLSALSVIASNFSRTTLAFAARVTGLAFFGEKHNEPVMLCELTSELALMRAAVQQYSQSEHKEFLNVKSRPRLLYFNRLALWPEAEGPRNAVTWWFGA